MNTLSTHVLDTTRGVGAAGMRVHLHGPGSVSKTAQTVILDESGRGAFDSNLTPGIYELQFEVGAYHERSGPTIDRAAFLGVVPVRFSVAENGGHYHVPLIVSLYGYSTYRGG